MKYKILIIDDEISICELLKITLVAEGYEVSTANDGLDGLKKVGSFDTGSDAPMNQWI